MSETTSRASQAARTLDDLSAKVTLNAANGFAGCFALVPPGESEPVTLLILDPEASPAVFWSLVSTKAKMALDALADEESRNGPMAGFGGRR